MTTSDYWGGQAIDPPVELKDGWEGNWFRDQDQGYRLVAWRDFPEGQMRLTGWFAPEIIAAYPAYVTEMLNREAAEIRGRWPTPKAQWDELMLGKKKHEEAEAE